MADGSVVGMVVRSMLMSAWRGQKYRWNVMVEAVQLADEELGKMLMQNRTTDIQVLPMSRPALAVVAVEEREDVGMESTVPAALLSSGVVDSQGIRE